MRTQGAKSEKKAAPLAVTPIKKHGLAFSKKKGGRKKKDRVLKQ